MGTMVRINEDNYEAIKKMADYDGRSVTNMTNRLLDRALNRDTSGEPDRVIPNIPIGTGVAPNITKLKTSMVDISNLFTPEKNTSVATPLPDADDIRESNAEYDCCKHPSRPCKHWVWDSVNGDGYRNTLSGRYREAD